MLSNGRGLFSSVKLAVFYRDFILYVLQKMANSYLLDRISGAKEKAKAELLDYLETCKRQVKLLDGVKRKHKKDGGDFQDFLKNFELTNGGRLTWSPYSLANSDIILKDYPDELYIKAYTCDEKKVKEMEEKRPERISHNWPYLKDGYIYTLDEVEQEFKSELEKAKKRLTDAEQNIKDFDANFWKFEKLAGDIVSFLDAMPDGIYYKFKTIMKENV